MLVWMCCLWAVFYQNLLLLALLFSDILWHDDGPCSAQIRSPIDPRTRDESSSRTPTQNLSWIMREGGPEHINSGIACRPPGPTILSLLGIGASSKRETQLMSLFAKKHKRYRIGVLRIAAISYRGFVNVITLSTVAAISLQVQPLFQWHWNMNCIILSCLKRLCLAEL